jgi:hypothetical protein
MWKPDADATSRAYGPIRGTCEIWSQATYKGDLLWEKDGAPKMRLDDDAPKKAMTDALTKGLSHLGVSADVFLGLYDDNKYVQSLKNGTHVPGGTLDTEKWTEDAKKEGLTVGDKSQYQTDKLKKAVAAGWKITNTTAKGKVDQLFDYLDMVRNPDDVAVFLNVNAQEIVNSGKKNDIAEAADNLLRYFEQKAAPNVMQAG